jgi:hypothetical protein
MESGRKHNHNHDERARPKVVKRKHTKKKKSSNPSSTNRSDPADAAPSIEDQTKIKSRELAIVFNPKRDVIKPYHIDGDSAMYTEEMKERRAALKDEPLVVESINEFINLY